MSESLRSFAVETLRFASAPEPKQRVEDAVWTTLRELKIPRSDTEQLQHVLSHAVILICEDREGFDTPAAAKTQLRALPVDELAALLAIVAQASSTTIVGAIETLKANLKGSVSVIFARESSFTATASTLDPSHLSTATRGVVIETCEAKRASFDRSVDETGGYGQHSDEQKSSEKWRVRISIAVVCIVWLLLVPAGAYGAVRLFDKLTFADFKTQPNTVLGRTQQVVNYNLGQLITSPVYIIIRSVPRGQSLVEGGRAIELAAFTLEEALPALESQFGTWGNFRWPLGGVAGYFLPVYNSQSYVGGTNNDTSVIVLNWMTQGSKPYTAALQQFLASSSLVLSGRYTMDVTGMPQLLTAMKDTVLTNMATIDAICIPLSFVIFAMCVGTSPAALLVPLITLPASLAIALGASAPLTGPLSITAFAPEIMLSVCIALTMDFALFLLCRVREQLDDDRRALLASGALRSPEDAQDLNRVVSLTRPRGETVKIAMKHVSHNIGISGFAITAAFGALGIIKEDFVRGCAFVSAIGALTTTLISLTLLPSVTLLLFPIVFRNCFKCCKTDDRPLETGSHGASTSSKPEFPELLPRAASTADDSMPLLSANGAGAAASASRGSVTGRLRAAFDGLVAWALSVPENPEHNVWGRMATFAAHHSILVLVPVLALTGIFIYVLVAGFKYDYSSFATCPHDIEFWDTYHDVTNTFGTTTMTPYYITVSYQNSGGGLVFGVNPMTSQSFWAAMSTVVAELLQEPRLQLTLNDIGSPNVWRGQMISLDQSMTLMAGTSLEAREYQLMVSNHWRNNMQPLIAIALRPRVTEYMRSWGAGSTDYMEYLKDFCEGRLAAPEITKTYPPYFSVGYWGPNAAAWSVMMRVMDQFELQVIITFATLTFMILVMFRSVVIALRMVCTMMMTAIVSFGTVTFVTRWGYFAHVWPAVEYISGWYWVIPVLSFSILCVVSLDYDVFLVTRVIEIRKKTGIEDELRDFFEAHKSGRYSHDAACIISAVARTGPVISWAAAIMTMAFGVLAFSNTVMMAQYGLVIAIAVLFDAFIVRPLVVPAFVSLIPGRVLWFPRRFEQVESPLRKAVVAE